MRRCARRRRTKEQREKRDAGAALATGPLHGVGYADAGVDTAVDSERGKHLGIGSDTCFEHGGEKQ